MKDSPKISIVIACYNDPDVIKAVRSAYGQLYPNKEIIVIDDGSNKVTARAIESVNELIDIHLTQTNQGQSSARNNGIKRASGEYILNLDSDDFFEPGFCEQAINEFLQAKDVKIVTCKAYRFNKKEKIDVFTPRGGDIKNFLFKNSAMGSSMFKRKDWEICGGYEEKLPILGFEDWEFYIRLLKTGGYAFVIQEPLFNYQIRENSTTSKIKHLKQEKFKHIIIKHNELYKDNFESLIDNLFERIYDERKLQLKLKALPEFKFGTTVLKPLRYLKAIFN